MPRPRTEIRDHIPQPNFAVADARTTGVTRGVLRHERFAAGFHGLRSTDPPTSEARGLSQLIEMQARRFLPALRPGEVYSHTTALILLECPIRCDAALHVTTPGADLRHRRPGVQGHRTTRPFEEWVAMGDIPVMPPARALVQAAATLPFRELVVAFDALLVSSSRPNRQTRCAQELALDLESLRNGRAERGVRRLRAAQQFARVGAESRMETLTRLELARVGLAASFELQVDLHDQAGDWIGRFDLVDRVRRLIVEYDGEQHRTDRAQYLKDLQRLERARAAGYRVIRVHWEDLFDSTGGWLRTVSQHLALPMRPVAPVLERLFREGQG